MGADGGAGLGRSQSDLAYSHRGRYRSVKGYFIKTFPRDRRAGGQGAEA